MSAGSERASTIPLFSGFGLSLSNEGPVGAVIALAQQAAALGYDEISLPESRLNNSVFSTAAAVLATTERGRVRIGIANPVTRHPAILALEAATLAGIAGPERVIFGISAAEWTNRALGFAPAGWKPLTNTLETLRALRAWLAGEPSVSRRRPSSPRRRPPRRAAHGPGAARHRAGQRQTDGGQR